MSWFQDDCILSDERPQEGVADGVLLQRRSFFRLSAATIAAGLAASCATVAGGKGAGTALLDEPPTGETLDLAEFMAQMSPRAKQFIASGGALEEAYLMSVGELMARLETPTYDQAMGATQAHVESRRSVGAPLEFVAVMFQLEPGKGFPHHDHRNYNGVILGVEGEVHIKNYDFVNGSVVPPEGATFQIRQTRDERILPGRFSTLGTSRDNIHVVTAGPEGATVLDVFTFMTEDAKSYDMDVEAEPRDAERGIFDATWV